MSQSNFSGVVLTKDPAFEEEEGIWVANVYFTLYEVDRKHRFLGWPSMKENEQGPLSTEI